MERSHRAPFVVRVQLEDCTASLRRVRGDLESSEDSRKQLREESSSLREEMRKLMDLLRCREQDVADLRREVLPG